MRITIHNGDGWYEEVTIDSSTLRATDSTGEPVVLFPAPGERDMTTLRSIIEEAAHDERPPAPPAVPYIRCHCGELATVITPLQGPLCKRHELAARREARS